MGASNSTPKNKTGAKVIAQKVENSKKTGVLSLQEHKLSEIPDLVFTVTTIRTLDVSKNKLRALGSKLLTLTNLKSLKCDENNLFATSLRNFSKLTKLQVLSAGNNKLGHKVHLKPNTEPKIVPLPNLPPSLKILNLSGNLLMSFPSSLYSDLSCLLKLEKLDLSNNELVVIPEEIQKLKSLSELNLDNNAVFAIPESVGKLSKLKVLSLRYNQLTVRKGVHFSEQNPQPIHPSVFSDTLVVDLNLDGNAMTSTQLNSFVGFDAYLERRKNVKTKNIYGGALTDLSLCGLE